ncbi:tetraspanin-33 isoform X5 [Hemicordylus capensis]|uniref:tetraspanin-33 isoform X5 n=1 Tax=Hemicordylus capensis TaxID=884348 RepID=UPI002302EFB9|nr:tetraspanin-33 isoform X5 [Hemicordylus capensis]
MRTNQAAKHTLFASCFLFWVSRGRCRCRARCVAARLGMPGGGEALPGHAGEASVSVGKRLPSSGSARGPGACWAGWPSPPSVRRPRRDQTGVRRQQGQTGVAPPRVLELGCAPAPPGSQRTHGGRRNIRPALQGIGRPPWLLPAVPPGAWPWARLPSQPPPPRPPTAACLPACLPTGAVDSLLAEPSTILLAVGILMFSVTFVGCLGALRDLPLLLKMFAWMLLIIFILQVLAALLGFLFSGRVMEKASLLMGRAVSHYRDNLDLQNLIDYIQRKFECCGVHSYKDWSRNVYFDCRDSNPSLERCAVPFSCCLLQGKEPTLNTMCGYGAQSLQAWRAESRVHTEGCLEKTVRWGQSNLLVVAGLASGLLALENEARKKK